MADTGKHETTNADDRKAQLTAERRTAHERGDTARVEAIDRELQAGDAAQR